ncbi:hypothetical protein [Streptomyces sp. NPDC020607]|uniref:hypothetical protein n=1 Tax=Streptomyces sp. NPDC020607 TaxID=3365082 RepID=UPI003792566A
MTNTSQGSHQYLLTLQAPHPSGGFAISTWTGTCTPTEGTTRHDIYQQLRQDVEREAPNFAGASLLFFDLQPNQL